MRKKYLTEEKFEQWKDNDFLHLVKKMAKIEGGLWVIIPLIITILSIVIYSLLRG